MADVRKRQDEKKTLLIVDDTPMNRALLSDILAPDYHILEAGTGREAVAELERHNGEIALVLLDVVMPDMDGFDQLQRRIALAIYMDSNLIYAVKYNAIWNQYMVIPNSARLNPYSQAARAASAVDPIDIYNSIFA